MEKSPPLSEGYVIYWQYFLKHLKVSMATPKVKESLNAIRDFFFIMGAEETAIVP